MAATPVDDHTEEFEQLAGLSALDVLDGEERVRFQQHVLRCERCQVMVRLDRQALADLLLSAPEMDPSADFKARLMHRAATELADNGSSRPGDSAPRPSGTAEAPDLRVGDSPAPGNLRMIGAGPTAGVRTRGAGDQTHRPGATANVIPFWRRAPVLRTLAAVFVLGLVTVGAFSYENQPVAQIALHGDAPGSAVVIIRRSGAAELEMRDVPDPGPGYVYEAWIIPQGQQPVAAGVVPSGNARVPLEGDVRGKTVAITREAGRVNAPTGTPLMVGLVQS